MAQQSKIGIVGAGIGGLTTAVALQQKGFQVVVYEQASELGEIGAGLTISVNAGRVFNALGLQKNLEALGPATPHLGTLDYKTGERLNYELRNNDDDYARYGTATRVVHRADLHAVLTDALDPHNDALRLNHELTDIEQTANQVSLRFNNGKIDKCDIVIACDGLRSIVRSKLFSAAPAEFTGFVAWRGLVERDLVPDISVDPHFATFPSPDKFFARYPVRHGTLINYVGIARKPDFRSESWTKPASVSEVAAEFAGWHKDVMNIILATHPDRCMRWALYGRQPLDSWISGRVCLLGDAAHPMRFMEWAPRWQLKMRW